MSSKFESVSGRPVSEFEAYDDPPADPVALARAWVSQAEAAGTREPRSMVLSTANAVPELTSRIVVILWFDEHGLAFATHSCSRKITDLAEVPYASGFFYWRELGRQLSIGGPVTELSREVSERVWKGRPVPLHSMSSVSYQSLELESAERLRDAAGKLETLGALPCPERFAVYNLVPQAVEFWSVCPDRLHQRLRYTSRAQGWQWQRLQP